MIFKENITKLIGKTPLVRINKLNQGKANIFAKIEAFNPLSSIKDRVALSIIEQAEKEGKLKPDSVIIEPTSGNTGIGLAYISAIKGYRLIITMPETMSLERKKLMRAFGAELVLTEGAKGMLGAIEKARELNEVIPNSFIAGQFTNPANPLVHKRTTAEEIWQDSEGEVDAIVAGVGTGGTISGVGEILKQRKPDVQIFAVEPLASAVLSGEEPAPHKIQGIGAGFIPEILNTDVIDEIIKVSDEDAFTMTRLLPQKEGILAGISSGAAMFAAIEISKREEMEGKNIIVILPDTGERYLSTPVFDFG